MTLRVVSDDERREAAERLRDEVGCGSSWPGMERLGLILGVEREPYAGWQGRFLSRLADLIEPSDAVKCVAEVKVDGEKLEKLVHDAVVECAGVDRDALLALADEMESAAPDYSLWEVCEGTERNITNEVADFARRIREACGEVVA